MRTTILLATLAAAVIAALLLLGWRHWRLLRRAGETDALFLRMSDENAELSAANRDLTETLADLDTRLIRTTAERDTAIQLGGRATIRLLEELHTETAKHTASLASITASLAAAQPALPAGTQPALPRRVPQALPSGDFLVADDKGPLILPADDGWDFLAVPEPAGTTGTGSPR